jgi:gluconate 2-dehydrogenase gamma chain
MIRRRSLLGAGLAVCAAGGAVVTSPRWRGNSPFRFFTMEEAATVEAITECLIPADRDPGGSQAGVVNYIDIQLTRPFKRHQRTYRQGIAAVEAESGGRFSRPFTALKPDEQVAVLTVIEKTNKPFFELILNHTRQGFYGDPRHGGNREMASWKMLGLPYPQVRGRRKA